MVQQFLIGPPDNLDERNVWIIAVWRGTAISHVECGFVRTDERIAPRLGAGVESGYRTRGVTTASPRRHHGVTTASPRRHH
jgi:hypothetical protein